MSTLKTNLIQTTSGKTLVKSTGSVLQWTKASSSSPFSNSSGTATPILSVSLTIENNNRIFCAFSGDMNANSNSSWQIIGFNIGGTQYHDKIIEHVGGQNMNADTSYLSPNLAAGTYTVAVNTRNGGGSVTYNENAYGEGLTLYAAEVVG